MKVKCQSCGALQDANEGQNCQFCGGIISVSTEINASIEKLNANGNLFKLAEVAFEGGDYDEAINYYNKCLELESDFFEAWYKKGLSILKTSTIGNFKSQQSISAFKQAINNSPNADSFKKRLKKDVIPFLCDYYLVSFNHFKQFKTLSNSGIEFAEKLTRANDTVELISEQIGLDIDEIKKIHGVLSDIGTKMAGVIRETMFDKGGLDKINNDFDHAVKKIIALRDEKLLALWKKLEPETAPQKKGCFIATAAMGNYNHPVVMDLRMFRDNWLLKRDWGIKFTNWYYTHGPKAASLIEKSYFLRKAVFLLIVKPLQLITKRIK
jgi:tetratricopeptide (TPR) repeat protein